MNEPAVSAAKPIFVVSDGTGDTGAAVVQAALAQFRSETRVRRFGGIRQATLAKRVVAEADRVGALVIFTLVDRRVAMALREEANARGVATLDVLGAAIAKLAAHLEAEPRAEPGLLHGFSDDYFKRIEAVEFAVRHDDGANLHTLSRADLVLTGISRTSKTPLSTFLAQKGLRVANVPLVLGVEPPAELEQVAQNRLYGLVIQPQALVRIRKARLKHLGMPEDSSYGTREHIEREIEYSREVFRNHPNWPVIDVTNKAIEETAADILRLYKERQDNPAS